MSYISPAKSQEPRLTCARGGYLWSPPILKSKSSSLNSSFFFRHNLPTLFPVSQFLPSASHHNTEFFSPQSTLLFFPRHTAKPCSTPLLLLLYSLQVPFGPGSPSLALLLQEWVNPWMLHRRNVTAATNVTAKRKSEGYNNSFWLHFSASNYQNHSQ